jgi:hypothetical protein
MLRLEFTGFLGVLGVLCRLQLDCEDTMLLGRRMKGRMATERSNSDAKHNRTGTHS